MCGAVAEEIGTEIFSKYVKRKEKGWASLK
jgi:hypothetical protein